MIKLNHELEMTHSKVSQFEALLTRLENCGEADIELNGDLEVHFFGGELCHDQRNYTMESYPFVKRPSENHVGGFAKEPIRNFTGDFNQAFLFFKTFCPTYNLSIDWYIDNNVEISIYNDDKEFFGFGTAMAPTILAATLNAIR